MVALGDSLFLFHYSTHHHHLQNSYRKSNTLPKKNVEKYEDAVEIYVFAKNNVEKYNDAVEIYVC